MITATATLNRTIIARAKLQTWGGRTLSLKKIALVSGAVNGSNTVFVWAHVPLQIFWQGQKLIENAGVNGYALSGGSLTSTHTEAPEAGDSVEAYGVY